MSGRSQFGDFIDALAMSARLRGFAHSVAAVEATAHALETNRLPGSWSWGCP